METTDKFDLDQTIEQWKSSLITSGNMSEENVIELQGHLMDEVEHISQTDLSLEEKFIVAQNRIGSAATLDKAYGQKKRISFQKLSWIAQAIMFFLIFRILSVMGDSISINTIMKFGLNLFPNGPSFFIVISLLLQIMAISLVFPIYRVVTRIGRKSLVKANLVAFVILIAVFFTHVLGMRYFGYRGIIVFPLISSVAYYFISFVLFMVFAVINVKEWRKINQTGFKTV